MYNKKQKAAAAHAQANQHKPKLGTPPETISEPLAETSIDGFELSGSNNH